MTGDQALRGFLAIPLGADVAQTLQLPQVKERNT